MMNNPNKNQINNRIKILRQKMTEHNIDAYLVLSDDFHASEYVSDYFKCREYISGFTGSAGMVVITDSEACLWTDGRYFLQAEEQLRGTEIILQKSDEEGVPTIEEYLKKVMKAGQVLGYDGRTVSVQYANSLKETLQEIFFFENVDLIGEIWNNRPLISHEVIWELDEKYSGKSRNQKLKELRLKMTEYCVDVLLISSLDDIAWLYNLRGNDIAFSPLFLAYTLVFQEKAILYMHKEAASDEILQHLEKNHIEIRPYHQVYEDLKYLNVNSLMLDESKINVALKNNIADAVRLIDVPCPVAMMKAVKNQTEIENERYAHLLDGVAVTKMIYRLKKMCEGGDIKQLTELDICSQLEKLRSRADGYIGQSFAPIIATGAHGAIVHYAPTNESNIPVEMNNFLLMDTGGHYLYGTTDITRTIAIGNLTNEQKRNYTAVLRGHLNLGAVKFEQSTLGSDLDELARKPMKDLGYDYKHGTGHGVGYLLSVHEGPQSIRPKAKDDSEDNICKNQNDDSEQSEKKQNKKRPETLLEAGMITSDEPGIYIEGQYGIRIENLILCKEMNQDDLKNPENGEWGCPVAVNEREKVKKTSFLEFEHLTLVPYEKDAIFPEMLTENELKSLNKYHKMVYKKIAPFLNDEEKNWLRNQTMELKRES